MTIKRTYLLLILTCLAGVLQAQISPLADQFLINPFLTNPAYAGTTTKSPLSITARQQWLGLRGAPSWQTATWHTGLNSSRQRFNPRGFINKGENAFGNIGVGGGLFNVKYGAISQVGIHLDYAYHLYMGNGRLSFGLSPMYYQLIIDKSGFLPPDGNDPDPLIDGDSKEVLHFIDVNAGVHYYSDLFFAGASVVQLFNSGVKFGDLSFPTVGQFYDNPYLARSIYVYGGATPAINRNITLEPSVLLKYNNHDGFGFQINMRATIYQDFQAGLLYRFRESAGFFAGARFGDVLVRYQFEIPIGKSILTGFTTNQIMVGYFL